MVQHAGHKFEEIKNYAQKQKDDLKQSAQSVPDAITKLNKAIVNGKAMMEKWENAKWQLMTPFRMLFKSSAKH